MRNDNDYTTKSLVDSAVRNAVGKPRGRAARAD